MVREWISEISSWWENRFVGKCSGGDKAWWEYGLVGLREVEKWLGRKMTLGKCLDTLVTALVVFKYTMREH